MRRGKKGLYAELHSFRLVLCGVRHQADFSATTCYPGQRFFHPIPFNPCAVPIFVSRSLVGFHALCHASGSRNYIKLAQSESRIFIRIWVFICFHYFDARQLWNIAIFPCVWLSRLIGIANVRITRPLHSISFYPASVCCFFLFYFIFHILF